MSRDRQRLADHLARIIEAIERIESHTEDMAELAFLKNHPVQDAGIPFALLTKKPGLLVQ